MLDARLSQQARTGGGGHAETTLPLRLISLCEDNLRVSVPVNETHMITISEET